MPPIILVPVANPAHVPAFQWADVPESEREWLRRRTEDARTLYYRVGCDFARLGMLLAEIRLKLKRRTFRAWLAAETPFSRAHAYRLIAVGAAFGRYVSQIETLEPAALYLLSRPDVPAKVRELAATIASDGTPVTRATALQILAAHKAPPLTGRALKDGMTQLARTMKPIRDAEKVAQAGSDEESEEDRDRRHARLGAALEQLLVGASMVHISPIDEEEGPTLYSVRVHRDDSTPRVAVNVVLVEALEIAAGRERERRCPACPVGVVKKLSAFSLGRRDPEGHNMYCRACEAPRVKASKKRRKAQRVERAAEAGARPAA